MGLVAGYRHWRQNVFNYKNVAVDDHIVCEDCCQFVGVTKYRTARTMVTLSVPSVNKCNFLD